MIGIALGAASFLVVFWVDAASLKGLRRLKPALWVVSLGLFGTGLALCLLRPERVRFPLAGRVAAGGVATAFLFLLLWSLVFEIPFVSAYVAPGRPSHLVTEGTYALCRHPGVLWLSGFLICLFFATGSIELLAAMPLWIALDTAYVVLQEKIFFDRLFGDDYAAYRRSVPMLFPTAASIGRCARTVFRKGN